MAMVKFMRCTISSIMNIRRIPSLNIFRNNADSCGKNDAQMTLYDCRKYGHQLPSDNITPYFEVLPKIPSGVFRCTDGEVLGFCGACKNGYYQNPEFFSYHHMSFYDLQLHLRKYRIRCPDSKRKR